MERGAEPVVLVPGLASDARVFAPQVVALSGGRAVHVGHVAEDTTIEGMARSILADAPPRFAIAGHSMGGIVALEVVRQAPERVTRLALIASDCFADPARRRRRAGGADRRRPRRAACGGDEAGAARRHARARAGAR